MSKKAQQLKRDYSVESAEVTVSLKDNESIAVTYSPDLPENMLPLYIGAILQHGADVIATHINNSITALGKSATEAFESVREIVAKLEDGTLPTRKGASGEAAITAEDKYNCLKANFAAHFKLDAERSAKFLAMLDTEYAKTTTVVKKKKDGTEYTQVKRSGLNTLVNKSPAAQEVLTKYLETATEKDSLADILG